VTAALTALREFHSVAHPIDEFVSPNKLESGLLGLDQLKDLLLCEEVKVEYGMTTHDVSNYYRDAFVTLEFEKFVIGATDRLLEFRDSNKVFRDDTTFFFLEIFETVIPELQRATTMENKRLYEQPQMMLAETKRFNDLAGMLEQCFDLIHRSLRLLLGSTTGQKELDVVSDEIIRADGLGMEEDEVFRHMSLLGNSTPITPRSFYIVSSAILEQLNEWKHHIRLEIALDKMLNAMPHLEQSVFGKLPVAAWRAMLVGHGMEESGKQLVIAVDERRCRQIAGDYINTSALSFSLEDPVKTKKVEDWLRCIPLETSSNDERKDTEEMASDEGFSSGEE
jgi:hypothetical protein